MVRQDSRIDPLRDDRRKGGQLFGPGGKEDVPLLVFEPAGRVFGGFKASRSLGLTGWAEQSDVPRPGLPAGFPDRGGDMGRIGVGRVHAERAVPQKLLLLFRAQGACPDFHIGDSPLFLASIVACYTDRHVRPRL